MAQAVDSPSTTGPQPAPPAAGRATETGNSAGETAGERPKVAAELVRTVPASELTASRPIDPGVGEGEDVVFVMYPILRTERNRRLQYPVEVPKYVRTAMPESTIYWPQDLDGIVSFLTVIADQGRRIRRLRIIAHSRMGTVLVVPGDAASAWVEPKTVEALESRKEYPKLGGEPLLGRFLLEVSVQRPPRPDKIETWNERIRLATNSGIVVRDHLGHVYRENEMFESDWSEQAELEEIEEQGVTARPRR